METVQLGARINASLVQRVDAFAAKSSRNRTQVVESCLEEFLPVLEAGIYGTPVWDRLKERWHADLAEIQKEMDGVAGAVRSTPGTAAAKSRRAA